MGHYRFIDLTGQRFGRLLVTEQDFEAQRKRTKRTTWKCVCDCGTVRSVLGKSLRNGDTKSCGCLSRERTSTRSAVDLTGQRYKRLVAVTKVGKNASSNSKWKCICDCGNITYVTTNNWGRRHGSCGCLSLDAQLLPNQQAGFNKLYRSYRDKAVNSRNLAWAICEEDFRTLTSSSCYYCGFPPSLISSAAVSKTTRLKHGYYYNGLDRVDNDKGYVLENVVPCCEFCNRAKLDYTYQEFLDRISRIYTHQQLNNPPKYPTLIGVNK